MSYSVIYILLFSVSLWASDLQKNQGCVIPMSGPQKGLMPEGCDAKIPQGLAVFEDSQVRCKVIDVKCDRENRGEYLAVAKVEQWLKGKGPKTVEFRFNKKQNKLGRGLCADLTLEKQNSDWVLTKIENPTSSSDSLPSCP